MKTVVDAIKVLLPEGTRPLPRAEGDAPAEPTWDQPPYHPADVFGVAASLLQKSGAYQYVLPSPGITDNGPALLMGDTDRKRIENAANLWRKAKNASDVPPLVMKAWQQLMSEGHVALHTQPTQSNCPAWWRPATTLMLLADSAAEDLGFSGLASGAAAWYVDITRLVLTAFLQYEDEVEPVKSLRTFRLPTGLRRALAWPASISQIPTSMHCVLPKSRTPNVGCTLRSLSHNLALLPGAGVASAHWVDIVGPALKKDDEPLNLLLVPFPYTIHAGCFDPMPKSKENWDSYKLDQRWLGADRYSKNEFVNFVGDLIEAAERDVPAIDAVVFPELALNWPYFEALSEALREKRSLEFIVAGVSSNEDREPGNYVATTIYTSYEDDRSMASFPRAKHHRWRLDERQIRRYALSAYLDPTKTWWEKIDIPPRELDVLRFRNNSTLATLICEDLARVDPCQELIRSIGPNLVLVLLMDGPQLKPRWPGRYATVLADDPGSSVLTLTSLGLINRQRLNGEPCPLSIALWKDDDNDAREIHLAEGDLAAVLSLTPRKRSESFSMDGRQRENIAWHLGGVQPVTIRNKEPYARILRAR